MRALVALALVAAPVPAAAQEVFAGVLAHGVDTPFTFDTGEGGVDVQLGWRGVRTALPGKPSPHVFASVNARGDTSFVAAGLSWRVGGDRLFVRPGIGIAIHDGPSRRCCVGGYRSDLGSRVLFEPEMGVGTRLSPRWTVEATWTHVSHARLFGGQNPGLDMIGVRVTRGLR